MDNFSNKKHFQPMVRRINGIVIYFQDKKTIKIYANGTCVVFFIFSPQQNYYRYHWRPFRERMIRNNNLETIWDCMKWGKYYGIDMMSARGSETPPKNLPELPSRYVEKRKKNEKAAR